MNFYRLFASFEKGEALFTEQEPQKLDFYFPKFALHQQKPVFNVDDCYPERGMSDFLKVGLGLLASSRVQQVFFDNDFTGGQFIPVEVNCEDQHLDYAFINPIAHYDLLDAIASKAKRFNERLDSFAHAEKQIIDPTLFANTIIEHDCFTLSTYKDSYFVSEPVKVALEAAGVTGVTFYAMEFSS